MAIALAVSWKPLVKSNRSAVTMTTTTISEIVMGQSSPVGGPRDPSGTRAHAGMTVRPPGDGGPSLR
ncbi:hypothetical protein GCM10009836_10640 [Pseudonocardia ailaonensis]|uniref:Uncharacterized protein n=1 Tax=Pseudonocardia ailaonensis TaxID=367279 RepID=A0ABN2MST5_9PSEU